MLQMQNIHGWYYDEEFEADASLLSLTSHQCSSNRLKLCAKNRNSEFEYFFRFNFFSN